jgi:serine/threonine protein kinase
LVGEGSFSTVYTAIELQSGLQLAIKVIPYSLKNSEIDVVSRLDHPGLLQFHEFLSDEDSSYLVTEYLSHGTLLRQIRAHGRFTESGARVIFAQLLDAVTYLQEFHQITHFDLKLENIMFDSTSRTRIIDFGLAHALFSTPHMPQLRGSVPYASPEILTASHVDERTDIWSLGVILAALISGRMPFVADDRTVLISKIVCEPPSLSPDISEWGVDLITRMLEKDPAQRISLPEAKHIRG